MVWQQTAVAGKRAVNTTERLAFDKSESFTSLFAVLPQYFNAKHYVEHIVRVFFCWFAESNQNEIKTTAW